MAAGAERARNPFEFGQSVGVEAIVDREEELRRLRTAVHNGERLFLIGPRRFGKTTLLNVVQHQLEGEGLVVLQRSSKARWSASHRKKTRRTPRSGCLSRWYRSKR